jgi:hypothetical protein
MHQIVNVEVRLKPGEDQEKLLRRFLKKCKKCDIVKEYLLQTSFAQTKSQKLRAKRIRNRYLRKIEKM